MLSGGFRKKIMVGDGGVEKKGMTVEFFLPGEGEIKNPKYVFQPFLKPFHKLRLPHTFSKYPRNTKIPQPKTLIFTKSVTFPSPPSPYLNLTDCLGHPDRQLGHPEG